jgi:histidinol-phosphate phosphatase family protein
MRKTATRRPSSRGLFLDRDGVLNEHVRGGYVLRWEEFVWRPGAISSLRRLTPFALPIVIVTNQSCVGRGLVSLHSISSIMDHAVTALEEAGVPVDGWYCCPHAPDQGCDCRKPSAGMLRAAAADLNLDLAASYLIGDSDSDIAAGKAAGCRTWKVREPADFDGAISELIARERSSAPSDAAAT